MKLALDSSMKLGTRALPSLIWKLLRDTMVHLLQELIENPLQQTVSIGGIAITQSLLGRECQRRKTLSL